MLGLFVGSGVGWAEPPADEPERTEEPQPAPQAPPNRPERRIPPEVLQQLIEQQRARQQQRQRPQVPQTPIPEDFEPGMNLLGDPGFEAHERWDEGQPWWNSLKVQGSQAWVEFDIAEGEGRSGGRAAHLHMDSSAQPGPTRVHGVVQEMVPPAMPRYVSGWYRVENWERGAEKQYLQTVVVSRRPSNAPANLMRARGGNYSVQLAMTLAGAEEPPLFMGNRKFEVTGPAEPVEGAWVFFEFDLHELFTKHWGRVPEDSDGVRIFFEVRYDKKPSAEPVARCDVYFDDLYFGDSSRAESADASDEPASD